MPFDAFMKIDGIAGESKDHQHANEIEVISFHWGVRQTGTWGKGGGGGGGKAALENFAFVKRLDRSSPVLFAQCCSGKHIKKAIFTIRKAGGDQLEYMRYEFDDIMLTQVRPGGASQGPDEIPMEEVAFDFTKVTQTYFEQSSEGGKKGQVITDWDLQRNTGSTGAGTGAVAGRR